jgi:predicted MFS family arabinose efflux permease
MDWTARRSLIPDLVGKARTMDAMLLEGVTQNITRIVGPFSSGALIDAVGARGCYAVLTCISAAALLMLFRLSREGTGRSSEPEPGNPWARMVEGFSYVRRNRAILGTFLITLAMNFWVFPYMGLLPVFARDILGQGPTGLGLLGAATGVGSFLGLLVVNLLRNRYPITRIYYVGSFMMACAVVAFAQSTTFSLSFCLLLLSGIGQACFGILQSSIVLLSASDSMRSRAMGAIVLGIGGGPPGRLQIGALAETYGAPFAVVATSGVAAIAVLTVVAALPGFRSASGQKEEM